MEIRQKNKEKKKEGVLLYASWVYSMHKNCLSFDFKTLLTKSNKENAILLSPVMIAWLSLCKLVLAKLLYRSNLRLFFYLC